MPHLAICKKMGLFPAYHPEEEPPSDEAQALFLQGQQYANAEEYEQAITILLKALQISPLYEKAKAYLDFCLNKASSGPRAEQRVLSPKHLPTSSDQTLSKSAYTDLLLNLLEHLDIQKDQNLMKVLEEHVEQLISKETPELTPQEKERARWTEKLLTEDKKVRSFVATKLKQLHGNISARAAADPVEEKQPVILTSLCSPSKLPEIAFGKALWAKFFGDIGEEPPLPPDIEKILNSPCPIWPDKKVRDTHLLVLVPQTVNGNPLNLKTLGELVQKPLQGTATKYFCDCKPSLFNCPPVSKSHWALMSRNLIPGSCLKTYQEQHDQFITLQEKSKLPYELPMILDAAVCIFMEYFRTGVYLYGQNPRSTLIRCQEQWDDTYKMVVGCFGSYGLHIYNSYLGDGYDDMGVAVLSS